jgi:hypothetical protein
MKISELNEAYIKMVKRYTNRYISRIDDIMISGYKDIKKNRSIEIRERHITNDNYRFRDNIREEVIKNLRDHYNLYWSMEEVSRDSYAYLLFKSKEQKPFGEKDVPKINPKDILKRSEILDL